MTINIYNTDSQCTLYGKPVPGLPTFVHDNRILWPPTDWARELVLGGTETSSVKTYANHLLDLLRQMEVDKMSFESISVGYLRTYRASLEARGAGANYVAQLMGTQLRYMLWLQKKNLVTGLIGSDSASTIQLPSSKRERSALLPKVRRGSPVRRMPSKEAILATKAALQRVSDHLRERDEIIMDWQQLAMLRACEVAALPTTQIPSMEAINQLEADGKSHCVTLVRTKGGKPRAVDVHPLLLRRTRSWIDSDRRDILKAVQKRMRARKTRFKAPPEIFVTTRGGGITPRTISNTIRSAWKVAKLELGDVDDRVWSHGLRHRGITSDLKGRLNAGQPGAVQLTMRQAGHSDEASMQPYVHLWESETYLPLAPESPESAPTSPSRNRR
jgi:integrase